MATEITRNCGFQLPHRRLKTPRHGTPVNIRMSVIPPESRELSCPLTAYVYLFQMFVVSSERRMIATAECVMTLMVTQGRQFSCQLKKNYATSC